MNTQLDFRVSRIINRSVILASEVKDYNTKEIICQGLQLEIDRFVMHQRIDIPRKEFAWLAGAVIVAVVFKIGLLLANVIPFNSDEAVVALMARHILQGSRPIFFYGQAYMGSLDAFLIAGVFKLIGTNIWAVRMVQIGLYSFTLLTAAILGRRLTGSWKVGVLAAWLLAIPNVGMTLYTSVSMGGYGEMLLIGNLILLTTLRITRDIKNDSRNKTHLIPWFVFGLLSGLGLWVFGLTLVYSIPAFMYLIWYWLRVRSKGQILNPSDPWWKHWWNKINPRERNMRAYPVNFLGIALIGGIVGCMPWLAYAQRSGLSNLVSELSGSAIGGVESLSYLSQFTRHALNFSLFGSTAIIGFRPPWEIRWLAMPLAPFVLIFWVAVAVFAVKNLRRDLKVGPNNPEYSHVLLLCGVILLVAIGFVTTPFGADPSGRYFLPIGVVMAILASQAVWSWKAKWGNYVWLSVGIVLAFHLWGTQEVISRTPPGITTQIDAVTQIDHHYDSELIEFLQSEGEYRGYTNYWVSYPLAFLSDESLIYIPRLPYHQDLRYTPRDDRYPPYDQLLDEAQRIAYITTNNPELDDQLRTGFMDLGVSWKETKIGDYQIYYRLSQVIAPSEIGLGGDEG
ncbi:MAG: hypothetical protein ABUK20_10975 [Anaerolineales bacterium]